MEKQFTATVYIIHENKTLLLFHKKHQKWLPPGGHMEANETPPETARREALEECGLHIEFVKQENVWINRWNANSFERPYMCLLEEIPAYDNQAVHQHIDFIYLAAPSSGQILSIENENQRWFTLEQIEQLQPDVDIFVETQEAIREILKFTRM